MSKKTHVLGIPLDVPYSEEAYPTAETKTDSILMSDVLSGQVDENFAAAEAQRAMASRYMIVVVLNKEEVQPLSGVLSSLENEDGEIEIGLKMMMEDAIASHVLVASNGHLGVKTVQITQGDDEIVTIDDLILHSVGILIIDYETQFAEVKLKLKVTT